MHIITTRWAVEQSQIIEQVKRHINTHTAGEGQRVQTYCRRLPETADILHKITRDCGHTAGDYQRLRTYCTRLPETVDILHKITRDCRHTALLFLRLGTSTLHHESYPMISNENGSYLCDFKSQRLQSSPCTTFVPLWCDLRSIDLQKNIGIASSRGKKLWQNLATWDFNVAWQVVPHDFQWEPFISVRLQVTATSK